MDGFGKSVSMNFTRFPSQKNSESSAGQTPRGRIRGKRARHALIDGARVLTKSEHFIHSLRLDESLSLGERIARRNSIAAEKNPMPRLRDDHARVIVCS